MEGQFYLMGLAGLGMSRAWPGLPSSVLSPLE